MLRARSRINVILIGAIAAVCIPASARAKDWGPSYLTRVGVSGDGTVTATEGGGYSEQWAPPAGHQGPAWAIVSITPNHGPCSLTATPAVGWRFGFWEVLTGADGEQELSENPLKPVNYSDEGVKSDGASSFHEYAFVVVAVFLPCTPSKCVNSAICVDDCGAKNPGLCDSTAPCTDPSACTDACGMENASVCKSTATCKIPSACLDACGNVNPSACESTGQVLCMNPSQCIDLCGIRNPTACGGCACVANTCLSPAICQDNCGMTNPTLCNGICSTTMSGQTTCGTTDTGCPPTGTCSASAGGGSPGGANPVNKSNSTVNVPPGGSTVVPYTATCTGTDKLALLFGDPFPSGLTVSWQPANSTFTFTAASTLATGTYSGSIVMWFLDGSSTFFPYTVNVCNPNISVSPNPATLVVAPGYSSQTTVSASWNCGLSSGSIAITPSGLPTGVTASPITVPYNPDGGSAVLTVSAASGAPNTPTPANVTLTGANGSLMTTATLPVSVGTASGALDSTFGSNGFVSMNLGSGTLDTAQGVAVDNNNNIVVVGSTMAPDGGGLSDVFVARFTPNGALDTTFNTTGIATFDYQSGTNVGNAVSVDSTSGEITVIGNAAGDFGVAKLTSAGILDTTFGTGGVALGGINDGAAYAGYVDARGNIVAGGSGLFMGSFCMVVARFLGNGSGLDTTFAGGYATVCSWGGQCAGAGGSSQASGMASFNGNIVAAGYCSGSSGAPEVALAEFSSSTGALVSAFGTAGQVNILPPPLGSSYSDENGNAVVVQPNGLAVAGYIGPGTSSPPPEDAFLNLRFTSSGSLDTTFGTTGWIETDFPGGQQSVAQAYAAALQTDGKIVSVGSGGLGPCFGTGCAPSKLNVGVIRMSGTNGALDTTFGGVSGTGNGLVSIPITTAGSDQANGIAFQSSGKIILVGTSTVSGTPPTSSFFVARVLP
jgi:uncharacterized delta-60 repeat protein